MTEKKLVTKAARALRRALPVSLPESVRLVKMARRGESSPVEYLEQLGATRVGVGPSYECSHGHFVPGAITLAFRGREVVAEGSCAGPHFINEVLDAIRGVQ